MLNDKGPPRGSPETDLSAEAKLPYETPRLMDLGAHARGAGVACVADGSGDGTCTGNGVAAATCDASGNSVIP